MKFKTVFWLVYLMLNYESRGVWLATADESNVLIGLRLVKHARRQMRETRHLIGYSACTIWKLNSSWSTYVPWCVWETFPCNLLFELIETVFWLVYLMLNYETRGVWLATAFESNVLIGLRLVKHARWQMRDTAFDWLQCTVWKLNSNWSTYVPWWWMIDAASGEWKWWSNRSIPLLGQFWRRRETFWRHETWLLIGRKIWKLWPNWSDDEDRTDVRGSLWRLGAAGVTRFSW